MPNLLLVLTALLLDAATAGLALYDGLCCRGVSGGCVLWGNWLLLPVCCIQVWCEGKILLGLRLFVPSWVRVLKYLAVSAALSCAAAVFFLAPSPGIRRLLCPLLGAVSFIWIDRAGVPDRRVTLWAFAISLVCAAGAVFSGSAPVPRSAAHVLLPFVPAWCVSYLVWKLALLFRDPREIPEAAPPASAAWTEDGYIRDQDALTDYTYRTIPASHNGCGPVAVYNLCRRAGREPAFPDVLREMDRMHLLCVPGPTWMYVVRRCLRLRLPGWREVRGRAAALAAAARSRMGLFRYHEQRIPHFVSFYRENGEQFRFFNVCDGQEDVRMTMAEFGAEHLRGGSVRLIYWPAEDEKKTGRSA